jgi:hypothetical protein
VEGRNKTGIKWLQAPNQVNEDEFATLKRDASRNWENKTRDYQENKRQWEMKQTEQTYQGFVYKSINEFKKSYQTRMHMGVTREP